MIRSSGPKERSFGADLFFNGREGIVTFRVPDDLHEKVIRSIEHCTLLAAIVLGERGLLLVGVKAGRDCRTL